LKTIIIGLEVGIWKTSATKIEDHNNWFRSWNERGQRKSGLEIPTMGMVRCLSEKPNESPVDSQKELSCVPKQPKESPVDSQESLEEESFRPSDDPLMVNFSDIPNPPCDLVNRPTSVVPLEVPCPKPRKPLDIFLVSKSMSMSMSARVPMATNTIAQQGQPTQPTPLALILWKNLPLFPTPILGMTLHNNLSHQHIKKILMSFYMSKLFLPGMEECTIS